MWRPTMLRQIFSVFALGFLTLTASCQTVSDTAGGEGWLTGQVVDERGVPIRAQLEIAERRSTRKSTERSPSRQPRRLSIEWSSVPTITIQCARRSAMLSFRTTVIWGG